MLHLYELAVQAQAEREREIRRALRPPLGLASGPRHPRLPEPRVLGELPDLGARRERRPAFGG